MLRYEGMTNRTNIYSFASWKKNCPAHEQWYNVIKGDGLSAQLTVKETLVRLKNLLDVNALEINMRNNKFVDKIISDKPEKEFQVMIPESKLDQYISEDKELTKLSYRTLFHKSFFENIDQDFPYQDLTLQQIGIPLFDVLQVSTEKGQFFVELSDDAALFL
jgi:adenylyltransferase/sulfurtransferase